MVGIAFLAVFVLAMVIAAIVIVKLTPSRYEKVELRQAVPAPRAGTDTDADWGGRWAR